MTSLWASDLVLPCNLQQGYCSPCQRWSLCSSPHLRSPRRLIYSCSVHSCQCRSHHCMWIIFRFLMILNFFLKTFFNDFWWFIRIFSIFYLIKTRLIWQPLPFLFYRSHFHHPPNLSGFFDGEFKIKRVANSVYL